MLVHCLALIGEKLSYKTEGRFYKSALEVPSTVPRRLGAADVHGYELGPYVARGTTALRAAGLRAQQTSLHSLIQNCWALAKD
jgi:hypothetical protein